MKFDDIELTEEFSFNDVLETFTPIQKVAFLQILAFVNQDTSDSVLKKIELSYVADLNLTIGNILDELNPMQELFVKDSIKKIKSNKELTHYGVLGMKWGIRKEYKKRGREEAQGRHTLGNFTRTKEEQDRIRQEKGVTFKNMNDDILVTKNIQSVLGKNNIDLNRSVYFSAIESDKEFWKALFYGQNEAIYVNDISLKKPLKIAGFNTMAKTWLDANKDDSDAWGDEKGYLKKYTDVKTLSKNDFNKEMDYYKKTGLISEGLRSRIQIESIYGPLSNKSEPNKTYVKYRDLLKKNGYDAFIDVNAAYGQVGYAGLLPAVLLNKNVVKGIKTTKINNKKFVEAKRDLLKRWSNETIYQDDLKKYGKAKADEFLENDVMDYLKRYGFYEDSPFKNPYKK